MQGVEENAGLDGGAQPEDLRGQATIDGDPEVSEALRLLQGLAEDGEGAQVAPDSVAEGHRETLGLGGVEGHAKAGDCGSEEVQVGLESGGVFRRPRVADEH